MSSLFYEGFEGTLFNEDCIKGMRKMDDDSVDLTFTSPPYNRIRNDKYKHYNDDNNNYMDLLLGFTDEALRVTKGYVIVNIQQNHFNKKEYFRYLGHYGDRINGIITWEKTNPQPSVNYRERTNDYSITNATEHFIFIKDGKEFRSFNKIKNIIKSSVNSERFEGHGAVMKLEVANFFIENFTRQGDVVLDPFNGIGTTWVSCFYHGRKYKGFELSEIYCQDTVERIKSIHPELDI